jgi:hypothetical protein
MKAMVRRLIRWLLWGPVDWRPPSEATPHGKRLYATDGTEVWEIWGSGEPINTGAIRVKAWAVRREPMPPAPRKLPNAAITGDSPVHGLVGETNQKEN